MGQGEVLKALSKGEELTEKEIANLLEITISSAWTCLQKLVKSGEVEKKESNLELNGKKTKLKCYVFYLKQDGRKKV